MNGLRWIGVYTPFDGLVHVVAQVRSSTIEPSNTIEPIDLIEPIDSIAWWCDAHTHGTNNRAFVHVKRVNCIPCMVALMEGWSGRSTRCHYIE